MRLAVLAACLAALPARAAEVYIGVDASRAGKPWALGLPAFQPEDPKRREDAEAARQAREVLRADLLFSRYFDLVEQGPAADTGPEATAQAWKSRGAAFLLAVKAGRTEQLVTFSVKLQDLSAGETVFERYYRQSARHWRSAVHRVADDVVRQLTGKQGIAQSMLAFANDADGAKEICLVDYDGAGFRRLTSNKSINLLPAWSPDKKLLAFTTWKDGNPDLYLMELARGALKPLSVRQGLNIAGGFSPDGQKLAVTMSQGKNPNIYLLGLPEGSPTRVTEHFGADSSPTFSPDGESLAFVSDRSGNPQVHVLELATGRARRLTHLNWCDAPAWSPTGEWVAFAGRANVKDKLDVFLVDAAGTRVLQLTHGEGSNEDPAWSPDGRFLAFTSTRSGRRQLFVMDADGSAPRPLADIPGNSFTPSWSP